MKSPDKEKKGRLGILTNSRRQKKVGIFANLFLTAIFFYLKYYVFDSLLLHLPPLRIHCVGGCG
jgi:hypothetical protein